MTSKADVFSSDSPAQVEGGGVGWRWGWPERPGESPRLRIPVAGVLELTDRLAAAESDTIGRVKSVLITQG